MTPDSAYTKGYGTTPGAVVPMLEGMLDKHGLTDIVQALEEVCGLKAGHVRETWGDPRLATRWGKAATIVGRSLPALQKLGALP